MYKYNFKKALVDLGDFSSAGRPRRKMSLLQGYDLIGTRDMWWNDSYDWSSEMEVYRMDRQEVVSPSTSVTIWSA